MPTVNDHQKRVNFLNYLADGDEQEMTKYLKKQGKTTVASR